MTKIAILTKKNGSVLKGYWNSKVYNNEIFFNVSDSGLKADVNWKKSVKVAKADISKLTWIDEPIENNTPKTVESWMALMAKTDK